MLTWSMLLRGRLRPPVHGATAGVVLTRAGHPLLPGLPTHPLLGDGSALLTLTARLTNRGAHAVLLCPCPGPDPAGHVPVTVLDCAAHPPHHLVAVMLLAGPATCADRPRSSCKSSDCWPRAGPTRIAAALSLTPRATATQLQEVAHGWPMAVSTCSKDRPGRWRRRPRAARRRRPPYLTR
ncbi:MAG TPA: hypothetical protein VN327_16105 [Pseudonocardiaceae bacterium]|nr:hypothetical protein [Pseudonocardiaceae bacterium]